MKFALLAIILVLVAAMFHIVFTVVDYGYNNPDSGGFTIANDIIGDRLKTPYFQNWFDNQTSFTREFFGVGRVVILAMVVVCFAAEGFTRTKVEG